MHTNFNHYGIYGRGWYTNHPGIWYAAGWAAGSAWTAASWASLGTWFAYGDTTPVDYDYGSNVTYDNDTVYVNNQPAGTADQVVSASRHAGDRWRLGPTGGRCPWMPLGVFALSQKGYDSSNVAIQLAVDKQGIIRGNYTNTLPINRRPCKVRLTRKPKRLLSPLARIRTRFLKRAFTI